MAQNKDCSFLELHLEFRGAHRFWRLHYVSTSPSCLIERFTPKVISDPYLLTDVFPNRETMLIGQHSNRSGGIKCHC